jgi:hypothetical protein
MGVIVAAGGVEYGVLQAETTTAVSIKMEATAAPLFILAICISSRSTEVLMIVAHPI